MQTFPVAPDTSSMIAFLQNAKGKDVDILNSLIPTANIIIPPFVVTELLSNPKLLKHQHDFIISLSKLEILEGFWERAGKSRAKLIGKGLKARLADTLIAQVCIDHDIMLVARDQDYRHFAKHCGLRLAS